MTSKLFVGIKFGHDGENVSMSVAVKTAEEKIFVESIDCRPIREGFGWIISFLQKADTAAVIVDGANGQQLLSDAMKEAKLKAPILPTVKQIIQANSAFMQGVFSKAVCHKGQQSLVQAISNCEKRAIGTNGGFGFRSIVEGIDIGLMDSMILAFWKCSEQKEKRKQQIRY